MDFSKEARNVYTGPQNNFEFPPIPQPSAEDYDVVMFCKVSASKKLMLKSTPIDFDSLLADASM